MRLADCGADEVPEHLRERMLREAGAVCAVLDPGADAVRTMKVLRAVYGGDPREALARLRRLRDGEVTGTLPEMVRLVRRLAEAGVGAEAVRSEVGVGDGGEGLAGGGRA